MNIKQFQVPVVDAIKALKAKSPLNMAATDMNTTVGLKPFITLEIKALGDKCLRPLDKDKFGK